MTIRAAPQQWSKEAHFALATWYPYGIVYKRPALTYKKEEQKAT